jgi:hypothetical protein
MAGPRNEASPSGLIDKDLTDSGLSDKKLKETLAPCNGSFALGGPLSQPDAPGWFRNSPVILRMPTQDELIAVTGAKSKLQEVIDDAKAREQAAGTSTTDPNFRFLNALTFDGATNKIWPTDAGTQSRELQELIYLSRIRDDASQVPQLPRNSTDPPDPIQGRRLPLSMFLQIRPQPPGARLNTARDYDAFPAVATGRELARYFEVETPGLPFRQALDYILQETQLSPPLLSVYAAAVEMATAAGLVAAWYFKWGDERTKCRKRPIECYSDLDVLYDRRPNSTNSADGPRRSFPPIARTSLTGKPLKPGEMDAPERDVSNLLTGPADRQNPGTPRHPAFPSGHSTYAAAAAYTLIGFYPNYAEQLLRLADNSGVGRMFAGIHWRSDHVFGHLVGRAIAELILQQLVDANIVTRLNAGQLVYMPNGLKYLQPTFFVEPILTPPNLNPCAPGGINQAPAAQGGRQGS